MKKSKSLGSQYCEKTLPNLYEDEKGAEKDYKDLAKKTGDRRYKRMSKDEKQHAKTVKKIGKTAGCSPSVFRK